jgi:hypothetical protein
MPFWWQISVVVVCRAGQLLFLLPFYLFFSGKAGLPHAMLWFIAVVAFQYALIFMINSIEKLCTRSKIEELMRDTELSASDEGKNE